MVNITNYSEILPQGNQTSDIFEIFSYINNVASAGLFFPVILASIWMIIFISGLFIGKQASRVWIFDCFVCSILAILLGLMGFLATTYIYFLIILFAFGLVWNKFDNSLS